MSGLRVNDKTSLMSRSYRNENSAFVRSSNALRSRARSRALLRSPISRDRCSQNLGPILRHEYIIFDANTAAAEAVIVEVACRLAVFALPTSFRPRSHPERKRPNVSKSVVADRRLALRPANRSRSGNSTPDAHKMGMSGRSPREAEWVHPRLSGGFHRGVLSLPQCVSGVGRDVSIVCCC